MTMIAPHVVHEVMSSILYEISKNPKACLADVLAGATANSALISFEKKSNMMINSTQSF